MKVTTKTSRNNGLAKVEVHPTQPKVKVTFKVEKEGEEVRKYVLEKEECPDYVQNGVFLVSLNADGDKMYSMRPVNGVFKLKVKEFVAAKDKEPAPRTKVGKGQNGEYAYQTFMVSFIITDGEFKGMTVPGSFSYNFQEGHEEVPGRGVQSVVEISNPRSKFTASLVELLTVTNVINKQLPYRENILPILQKSMLKEDCEFSGSVKKGFIDSLYQDETVAFE